MRCLAVFCVLFGLAFNGQSTTPEYEFFQSADQFFQEYVGKEGTVAYKSLHQNPEPLKELCAKIKDPKYQSLEGQALKAFYINAYNLLTIQQVVNHYPISSPKAIDGFFKGIEHQVAGKTLTLNELEKKTLLEKFPDPRLHFALVCAARGCPPLRPHAYHPSQLGQQLEQETQRALMDTEFIRVKEGQRLVRISKIFQWYKADFLREASSLLAYINDHRPKKLPADTKVRYYPYDWSLNGSD